MLELLVKFLESLTSALPKLYELYRQNSREEQIVELLESYYILGDLIESAENLMSLVENKDTIELKNLSKDELEKRLDFILNEMTTQLNRLKRLGEIFLSNPNLDLLDSNIKFKLKKAIGGKSEGGLYGIASILTFYPLTLSPYRDEDERLWLLRTIHESYELTIGLTETDKLSVLEQRKILD